MGLKGGSKSTSTVSVPKYLENELKYGLSEARSLYDQGAPEYYSGQTYANFDPLQEEAMQGTVDLARAGSPLVKSAQGYIQSTLDTPSGQNPYLDSMLEKYARTASAQTMANFNKSGRFGSGANVATAGQAISDATLPYLFQQYNQDNANKFQAAQMAPSMAEYDFNNLNRIASVGDVRQSMAQQAIDEDINRYNYNQNAQSNWLDQYLARVNSSKANDLTTTTQKTKSSPNVLGAALSLGTMAMGMPVGMGAGLGGAMGLGSSTVGGTLLAKQFPETFGGMFGRGTSNGISWY